MHGLKGFGAAARDLQSVCCPFIDASPSIRARLRESAMYTIRTILHPTDFSESARYAFELACALAQVENARLIILHVAVPPVVMYDESGKRLPPVADYRQAARVELFQLQAPYPGVRVEHRLDEGEVSAAILRVLDEVKPDLVIMGTHGRTGLNRLVIGSVAADVMRQSPCTVLAVRLPHSRPATGRAEARLDVDVMATGPLQSQVESPCSHQC